MKLDDKAALCMSIGYRALQTYIIGSTLFNSASRTALVLSVNSMASSPCKLKEAQDRRARARGQSPGVV